jgi:hypothetical protein
VQAASDSCQSVWSFWNRGQPSTRGDGQLWWRLEWQPILSSRLVERERVKAPGLAHKPVEGEDEGGACACAADAA